MSNMRLTDEELSSLRYEIRLGSLYYNDYKNTFNLKTTDVFDFFDAYLDYLNELMKDDFDDYYDSDFWYLLPEYDNSKNLIEFYHGYEYEFEKEV